MAGLSTLNSVTTLTGRDHVITVPETFCVLGIWDETRYFSQKVTACVEELPANQDSIPASPQRVKA